MAILKFILKIPVKILLTIIFPIIYFLVLNPIEQLSGKSNGMVEDIIKLWKW